MALLPGPGSTMGLQLVGYVRFCWHSHSARGFCSGDFGFGIPERGEGDVRLSMKAGRAHPPRYSQVRQVGDRQAGAVDESLLALSILCGTSDP